MLSKNQIKCIKKAFSGAAFGLLVVGAVASLVFVNFMLAGATLWLFGLSTASLAAPLIFMLWFGATMGLIFGAIECMKGT